MPAQREVILNVNVLDVGFHPSAWRAPDLHPTSFIDPDYYAEVAKIAERGTLDALFLADGPALREDPAVKPTRALEPTTVLGVVASATEHLGLIGTSRRCGNRRPPGCRCTTTGSSSTCTVCCPCRRRRRAARC